MEPLGIGRGVNCRNPITREEAVATHHWVYLRGDRYYPVDAPIEPSVECVRCDDECVVARADESGAGTKPAAREHRDPGVLGTVGSYTYRGQIGLPTKSA